MRFCAFGFVALASAACGLDGADGPSFDPGPAGEEELRELSLRITGTNGVEVKDSPSLVAGAAGSLSCPDRFDREGRTRLGCARGKEVLEVIVDGSAKTAVVAHRPSGRGVDTRRFFTCTTSGNGPGDLPARLACTSKAPSTGGHGGLASPFAATAEGFHIPNTHVVGGDDRLLRGMAPRSEADFGELVSAGVSAVLVFKNQTGSGHDVRDEMDELARRGLASSRIVNVPFEWKDLDGFETPCKQTIEALKFLETSLAAGRKTFFHCTVGEDRTGYLAAMRRLLVEREMTPERAWDEEMCERGYGSGNPLKPAFVVNALNADSGLTPLYRKMAFLVAAGRLSSASLDASVCAADPSHDPAFAARALPASRLACGTSTRFVP
jgi:hypothetical protein